MPIKMLDLRPCDKCGGPLAHGFYVLNISQALINHKVVNEFMGMHQFFGGQSLQLTELFSPSADDAVLVFGEKDPGLMTRLFICQDCFLQKDLDLALLMEKEGHRGEVDPGEDEE